MTHTLFVLAAKILIRELHEDLQSCLLQNYASNDVQYNSVVCLVHDLETKKVKKMKLHFVKFCQFFCQIFCQYFVNGFIQFSGKIWLQLIILKL